VSPFKRNAMDVMLPTAYSEKVAGATHKIGYMIGISKHSFAFRILQASCKYEHTSAIYCLVCIYDKTVLFPTPTHLQKYNPMKYSSPKQKAKN
jgi:hypothetical protein